MLTSFVVNINLREIYDVHTCIFLPVILHFLYVVSYYMKTNIYN
jgi:hypothetical protein